MILLFNQMGTSSKDSHPLDRDRSDTFRIGRIIDNMNRNHKKIHSPQYRPRYSRQLERIDPAGDHRDGSRNGNAIVLQVKRQQVGQSQSTVLNAHSRQRGGQTDAMQPEMLVNICDNGMIIRIHCANNMLNLTLHVCVLVERSLPDEILGFAIFEFTKVQIVE